MQMDNKMKIKAQASHFCKMLSKPEIQRMPFEGVQIAKILKKISFFKRFCDCQSQQFINMCLSSKLSTFKAGEQIYKNEGTQMNIYVLLAGEADVYTLENKNKSYKINEYAVFGEVEVLFNEINRYEQIISCNGCQCMMISGSRIKNILSKQYQKIKKCLNYITVNTYFEKISQFDKLSLALKMQKKYFSQRDIIIKQGQPNDQIFFIVHGCLSLIKQLTYKGQNCQFIIGNLQQMDNYGQYNSLYSPLSSEVTLIANNSGTYYVLLSNQIMSSNNNLLNRIHEKAIAFPNDEQLLFLFMIQDNLSKKQEKVQKKLKLKY